MISEVEIVMRHVEVLCREFLDGWKKDLGLNLWYFYLICCEGLSKSTLTFETLLNVTAADWFHTILYT